VIWRYTCESCGSVFEKVGPGGPHGIGPGDPLPWNGTCQTCSDCRPDRNWAHGARVEDAEAVENL